MKNAKLDYALHYAALGIPVLPLHFIKPVGICSCGGVEVNPKCKPGKHPYAKLVPHGLTDATTDGAILRQWFDGNPYNLGIRTGNESGIFALDRDDRDGGEQSLADLEKQYGALPQTLTQQTGNGYHYIFKLPHDRRIKCSAKKLALGLDIRGEGGYIVAPPSMHANGRSYAWQGAEFPSKDSIASAPGWLLDLIDGIPSKQAQNIRQSDTVSAVPMLANAAAGFQWPDKIIDGQGREDFIIRAAGHLRAMGMDQAGIDRILLDYNANHIDPPLHDDSVLDRARRYANQIAKNYTAEASNADAWSDPEPLVDNLPPVPTFPLKLLPDELAAYVQDVAERMCCPVEFPAIGVMVTLASAIGSRIACKPYANGTWRVPAGAWGLLVSQPSQMKTPPLSEALSPLKVMDKQAAEKFQKAMLQYQLDKAIYDKAVKAAINSGNNNLGLEPPVEPKMTRYVVNDSTYEMLVAIAQANPAGFLVFRDELQGWFHSLNKENQKEARGLYLTGWTGTEDYATDRIGRGHVRAECVNLSLLGTIQPNVLRQIVYDAVSGGGGDDGLVARFQFAVYPDPVKTYRKVDRLPNLPAMDHYHNLVKTLAELNPVAVGASAGLDEAAYLPFDDDAQVIFDNWRLKLEDRIRNSDSDEHPAMLAHLGKYRSLFPKLALILHLAAGKTGPIDKQAALRAGGWTWILEAHARRLYHTATNRAMQSAVALANKIKAGKLKDGFTRSDVLIKEWAGLRTAEEVATALTVLRDMVWLISYKDERTGGRPAERFYVNPKVKQAA